MPPVEGDAELVPIIFLGQTQENPKVPLCCVLCRTRILYALTEEEAELRRQEYQEACSLREAWKTLQDEADDADHDLDLPKKSFAEATKAEVRVSSACPLCTSRRVTISGLHYHQYSMRSAQVASF